MTAGGQPVYPFGVATYTERTLVSEHALVKIPDDAPFEVAALLGCGVMTGFGAAVNTAEIRPGDSVVVVGCGGVGLSAIQGARVAGASEIVAIDLVDSKLDLAKQVGATSTVNAGDGDPIEVVRSLTDGRGGDHVFEVIGLERTIQQSLEMTRPGGETILVGLPSESTDVVANAVKLIHENRTIRGSMYGSCDFRHDVLRLLNLYEQGTLFLDELITRRLDLGHVQEGFEAMEAGDEARSVIVF
jgi:Zn-dependent alcohol dehydrogenase